jgi:hypothetical protein
MQAYRNWPLVCLQELTTGSYRTGSQWLLSGYPESTYMISTVSRPAYLCTHRSWPPSYLCMSARKTWPPSRWDSRTWCRPTRRSRKRKGWKQQRPYFRSRIRIKYIYNICISLSGVSYCSLVVLPNYPVITLSRIYPWDSGIDNWCNVCKSLSNLTFSENLFGKFPWIFRIYFLQSFASDSALSLTAQMLDLVLSLALFGLFQIFATKKDRTHYCTLNPGPIKSRSRK